MTMLRIKQLNPEGCDSDSYVIFNGITNVWQKIRHTETISSSDAVDGIVTIHHGLGRKYVQVTVYDDEDHQVLPDQVRVMAGDLVEINLTNFMPDVDNWVIVIS